MNDDDDNATVIRSTSRRVYGGLVQHVPLRTSKTTTTAAAAAAEEDTDAVSSCEDDVCNLPVFRLYPTCQSSPFSRKR